MHLPSSVMALPSALVLLSTAQVIEAQAGAQQLPTAVRMMGFDAGEKFFHEYSAFGNNEDDDAAQLDTYALSALNSSSAQNKYRAPLAAHLYDPAEPNPSLVQGRADHDRAEGWRLFLRAKWTEARLMRRDFSCPTGSSTCSDIGYPDSCCQTGTSCVIITDTGLGSVGCCPDGQSCTGTIACSDGQEGCSSQSGGGCCISGYQCASVGCK